MDSLDDIMSRREPASAPEPEIKQEVTPQEPEQQLQEPAQQPEPQPEPEKEPAGEDKTPIGAIRNAEREKATKRYTEQVAEFDKKFDDYRTANDRRFEQLLAALQPKAEPKPAPDLYENPSAFVQHQLNEPLGEIRQALMHNSRLIAEGRHTEEAVTAADDAFTKAYQSGQLDPADYQRVLSSPNIYDAAVKWHKSRQAISTYGSDPEAYIKAEVERRLAEASPRTPAAPLNPQQMPSSFSSAPSAGPRAAPQWNGPRPLSEIMSR